MNNDIIDQAIQVLNEALEADPEAISKLFNCEVYTNSEDIASHPTIQCGTTDSENYRYRLRPLGLINGLFGVDEKGWGFITAVIESDGTLVRFQRTQHLESVV